MWIRMEARRLEMHRLQDSSRRLEMRHWMNRRVMLPHNKTSLDLKHLLEKDIDLEIRKISKSKDFGSLNNY
jgi:hypothetical protein